jgi:hypothetical protein
MNSLRHLIHAMKTDMRNADGYAVPLPSVLLSSTASILPLANAGILGTAKFAARYPRQRLRN